MPDIFTIKKRSQVMSKIRSKGTSIELKMIIALQQNGISFEYQPKIFGKPDFLIPPNIVVFCDSSFWHGRNWVKLKLKLKEGYWREHIASNRKRDRCVNKILKGEGYIIIRFWDDLINKKIDSCIKKIRKIIDQQTILS
jgi:DNA mismatch endonuclease (patch repair protein)